MMKVLRNTREAVLLIAFALLGCSSTVSRSELVGNYSANVPVGTDSLILRADGSYVHSHSFPGKTATQQTGTWLLEPPGANGTIVTFERFMFEIEPLKSARPGLWPAFVDRHLGKLRLTINEDMGLYYTKQ
jgi:hypothetical protein